MMTCKFDPENCNPECKTFSFCSFNYIQGQLNKINTDINFLYKSMHQLAEAIKDINNELEEHNEILLRNFDL